MPTPGNSAHKLVDEFVRYANQAGFESKFPGNVPDELKTDEHEGMIQWQIRPAKLNPWVKTLADQLPHRLPKAYLSFAERYRFCNFEVGPVMFFANTGHDLYYELRSSVFKDPALFPTLHKHGYLEFGKPFEGNYDPICFDTQRQKRGDAPIVQLDHEEILMWNRIRVELEIAPSFAQFMRRAIAERFSVS